MPVSVESGERVLAASPSDDGRASNAVAAKVEASTALDVVSVTVAPAAVVVELTSALAPGVVVLLVPVALGFAPSSVSTASDVGSVLIRAILGGVTLLVPASSIEASVAVPSDSAAALASFPVAAASDAAAVTVAAIKIVTSTGGEFLAAVGTGLGTWSAQQLNIKHTAHVWFMTGSQTTQTSRLKSDFTQHLANHYSIHSRR